MSELYLKTGGNIDSANYQDGDIIAAFNERFITGIHAQHICHIKDAGFDANGLRPDDSLARMWLEKTYKYKFERISAREVRRTNLLTLEEEILSDVPKVMLNGKKEHIFVGEFVKRRLKHDRHAIFGNPGKEFWFGGTNDYTKPVINAVWAEIERKTSLLKANHLDMPQSKQDFISHFVVKCEDFNDARAEELVASEFKPGAKEDDSEIMVKKRKNKVDWMNLEGVSALTRAKIKDSYTLVDGRSKAVYLDTQIVLTK